tara:strand:+ start:83 stop:502 length:420 start_codon:yes stop_codon:yes gene_type:complete
MPSDALSEVTLPTATRKRGRPKKGLEKPKAKRKAASEKVASNREAMSQFKQRILRSPKANSVLTSIFDAALDKEDPHRAVAWKLLIDRFAPIRDFEGDQLAGRSSVNITITGVGSVNESNVVEGEVIEDSDCGQFEEDA